MGRLSIDDLPRPDNAYRVDRAPAPLPRANGWSPKSFETRRFARSEDTYKRVPLLQRAQDDSGILISRDARRLARKLLRWPPATLGSSLWMRRLRIRVGGALWKLVAEGSWDHADGTQVSIFAVVSRAWEYSAAGLNTVDPRLLRNHLRTELNLCGAGDADGWLIAFLHGEWEPNEGVFRLHFHGIAAGGMVEVVDRLRHRPNFEKLEPVNGERPDPVRDRVWMTRKPITDLPYALTYLLKSFWPQRFLWWVPGVGKFKRQRQGARISEPHHSQVLIWLNQWRLSDLSLLMKVRVSKRGFALSDSSNGDAN